MPFFIEAQVVFPYIVWEISVKTLSSDHSWSIKAIGITHTTTFDSRYKNTQSFVQRQKLERIECIDFVY